jgi:hypothetical protein
MSTTSSISSWVATKGPSFHHGDVGDEFGVFVGKAVECLLH